MPIFQHIVLGHTYHPDSEEASLSVSHTKSLTHTSMMAPDILSYEETRISEESFFEVCKRFFFCEYIFVEQDGVLW